MSHLPYSPYKYIKPINSTLFCVETADLSIISFKMSRFMIILLKKLNKSGENFFNYLATKARRHQEISRFRQSSLATTAE